MAGVQAVRQAPGRRRRRHPVMDHVMSISFGLVLGCLVAVALIGLSVESSPWGPGTNLHDISYYPIMAALAAAPLLMLLSIFSAASRPGFALFSLAYISGIVTPLVI
jgi:hypothetical protein